MDCLRYLLIDNIFDIDPRKDILHQNIKFDHISKGQLTNRIDP